MEHPSEKFMRQAFEAAHESARRGDYPIGSIITKDEEVIAIGYETLKQDNDPVNGHAEIDAIRKACKKLNQPYLNQCVLYSTHEPCSMCASAAIWAKISSIVFSVFQDDMIIEMENKKKQNSSFSWRQIEIPCSYVLERGTPRVQMYSGFMREEGLKLFKL
jgi:tRNA(Arg) A34 adenosine deaminase TadA